jgi:hypothetical protein
MKSRKLMKIEITYTKSKVSASNVHSEGFKTMFVFVNLKHIAKRSSDEVNKAAEKFQESLNRMCWDYRKL